MKNLLLFTTTFCSLLLSSCLTEEDKNKCRFVQTGIIKEIYTKEFKDIKNLGEEWVDYTYSVRYVVITRTITDTVENAEYSDSTCIIDTTLESPYCLTELEEGDSVWVFKDWNGQFFLASISDTTITNRQAAIDIYYNKKKNSQIIVITISSIIGIPIVCLIGFGIFYTIFYMIVDIIIFICELVNNIKEKKQNGGNNSKKATHFCP